MIPSEVRDIMELLINEYGWSESTALEAGWRAWEVLDGNQRVNGS